MLHPLLIALAITAAVYVIAVAVLFAIGRRTAAKEVALLLSNLLILFKELASDPRVLDDRRRCSSSVRFGSPHR